MRHEGAEASEGQAWVCQHWLNSSVVVIGVAWTAVAADVLGQWTHMMFGEAGSSCAVLIGLQEMRQYLSVLQ